MPESRIPSYKTPARTNAKNDAKVDQEENSALGLEASYLLDVVGENPGDTLLLGGLETSLLSVESPKEPGCSFLSRISPERRNGEDQGNEKDEAETQPTAGGRQLPFKTLTKEEVIPNRRKPSSSPTFSANLVSPFSTMLRASEASVTKENGELQFNNLQTNHNEKDQGTWSLSEANDGDLSLRPCRKVSVIVHVSYHSCMKQEEKGPKLTTESNTTATSAPPTSNANQAKQDATKAPQVCLFPLIPGESLATPFDGASLETNDPDQKKDRSPTSITLNASTNARDLIVVNPSAFGKFIPSEITMQTARLVAQVANVESEDWARVYRFQHVVWPDQKVQSFSRLAQAMANDVIVFSSRQKAKRNQKVASNNTNKNDSSTSRVLIATGCSNDKTNVLFGRPRSTTQPETAAVSAKQDKAKSTKKIELLQEVGLFGLTFHSILQEMPHYAVCVLSVYEILQEDQISDLLATPSPGKKSRRPSQLHIRQPPDRKGAVVEGLTEFPVDSLDSLRDCLEPLLSQSPPHRGASDKESMGKRAYGNAYQGGHVVVTLKIWQSAVQHDLNLDKRCATLTFVNLAIGESQVATDFVRSDLSQTSNDLSSPGRNTPSQHYSHARRKQAERLSPVTIPSRRSAFLRTSVSSLGGVLRGAQLRQAGSDAAIPYRNSTLTKVLQRSLDHPECRVVVLACLSPLSVAYDDTLATLRYVERLLVRSGLPKSPFEKRRLSTPDTSLSASPTIMQSPPPQPQILMEQYAGKESILESVITDPRQRLARFYRSQQGLSPSTESSGDGSASSWRLASDYTNVDPATVLVDDQESRTTASRKETGVSEKEDDALGASQSTSLANYIILPVSPVAKGAYNDDSFCWKKKEAALLDAVDSFESNPGYLRYRPALNEMSSPQELNTRRDKSESQHDETQPKKSSNRDTKMSPLSDLPTEMQQNEKRGCEPNEEPAPEPSIRPRLTPRTAQRSAIALYSKWTRRNPTHSVIKPMETEVEPGKEFAVESAMEPIGMYQEPTSKLTSAAGFFREIATLESSVGAVKNAHCGIWQTSASSIRQIKEFQISQQNTMNELLTQRDNALDTARRSQSECSKLSQRMGDVLKEKDTEIIALKDDVHNAQSDRADVEKIAEEAIAAQDSLEKTVSDLEQKLLMKRNESKQAQEELNELAESKDKVAAELYSAKNELYALRSNLKEKEDTATELESQLKIIKKEHTQLAYLHAEGENSLKRLQEELRAANETHLSEKEEWKAKNVDLNRENRSLLLAQNALESELSGRLTKAKEAAKLHRIQLEGSKEELSMLREQDQLASKNMETERSTFRHQIALLRNSLAAAQAERDETFRELEDFKMKVKETAEELERTRGDLRQRISDVEELSMSLQHALEDQESLQDELFSKERALESFQLETRHRVQRVAKYRNDAASLLEKSWEENRFLVAANEQLQEALNRIKEERDHALGSRDGNCQVHCDVPPLLGLLHPQSKGLVHEQDASKTEQDVSKGERKKLREMVRGRKNAQRERTKEKVALSAIRSEHDEFLRAQTKSDADFESEREAFRNGREALQRRLLLQDCVAMQGERPPLIVWPVQGGSDRVHRVSSAGVHSGPHAPEERPVALALPTSDLNVRAEEIAACIASSARQSVHRYSHKPDYYDEDEKDKDFLIAALKRKVKILERALVFEGEASREGSTQR